MTLMFHSHRKSYTETYVANPLILSLLQFGDTSVARLGMYSPQWLCLSTLKYFLGRFSSTTFCSVSTRTHLRSFNALVVGNLNTSNPRADPQNPALHVASGHQSTRTENVPSKTPNGASFVAGEATLPPKTGSVHLYENLFGRNVTTRTLSCIRALAYFLKVAHQLSSLLLILLACYLKLRQYILNLLIPFPLCMLTLRSRPTPNQLILTPLLFQYSEENGGKPLPQKLPSLGLTELHLRLCFPRWITHFSLPCTALANPYSLPPAHLPCPPQELPLHQLHHPTQQCFKTPLALVTFLALHLLYPNLKKNYVLAFNLYLTYFSINFSLSSSLPFPHSSSLSLLATMAQPTLKVLQWNDRSLRSTARASDLAQFLFDNNIHVAALCETKFTHSFTPSFKNFNILSIPHTSKSGE
jgi:hypothetical protein